MESQYSYRDLEFESPFTSEEHDELESTEFDHLSGFEASYSNVADQYTPLQMNNEAVTDLFIEDLVGSLSQTELNKARELNEQLMKEDSLKWGKFLDQINALLTRITGMPVLNSWDTTFFASAVAKYQELKNLKPTNRGVIAIGTWSQMQDDLGFLNYQKPIRIDVARAVNDNRKYSQELWNNQLQGILQYFASIGIIKHALPLDSKFFALVVAKWQSLQTRHNLAADGALGPKSWAVLKTQITSVPAVTPSPTVTYTPTKWLNHFRDAVPSFARPLVYGLETFKAMADAIRDADSKGHFIYILGWMLQDDFQLIPGDQNSTLFQLLTSRPAEVEIRIIIWDNLEYKPSIGEPDYEQSLVKIQSRLNKFPNIKMYLDGFTSGTKEVAAALTALRDIISKVPDEVVDNIKHTDTWKAINKYKNQPNEGSHHEKILVVNGKSGLTAFCGGIDINSNRIGSFIPCVDPNNPKCVSDFDVNHPKKYEPYPHIISDDGFLKPKEILHDVHCQVKHHAAWKLLQRFIKRWHQFHIGQSGSVPSLIGDGIDQAQVPKADFADSSTSYVKIVHTFNQKKGSPADLKYGPATDRSIWDAIGIAIRNAERSIHIEDQYMLSLEIAQELNKKLTQDPSFSKNGRITFLTQDDEYAGEDIPIIKRMRKEFMDTLMKGVSASDPRVTVYMLDKSLPFPAHHQVHSKIYIIDEELVIIGSANCSRRSLTNDTETAAIVFNNVNRKNDFPHAISKRYSQLSKWIKYQPNPAVEDIELVVLKKLMINPLAAFTIGGLSITNPSFIPKLITAIQSLPVIVRKIVDPFNSRLDSDMEPEIQDMEIDLENPFLETTAFNPTQQYASNYVESEFDEELLNESQEGNSYHLQNDFLPEEAHLYQAEWDDETDYEEETISLPSTANAIPSLMAEDTSVPGYTCYVKIDLGRGNYPLNKTGIYVPSAFDSKSPSDILIYLHGITTTFPGGHAQIDDYWKAVKLPKYDLRIREEVNASGKNIVLVAPSLGNSPNAYKNDLSGLKGGFDRYMQLVISAINEYIVKKRNGGASLTLGNIILAAHSAGGRQMLLISNGNNPEFGPKIKECWGLDSLYGGVYNWMRWAKAHPDKKLFIYYKWSTSEYALKLQNDSKQLPNIFIKSSTALNHYWVVKAHLKERILKIGSPDISKINFETEATFEENYQSYQDSFLLTEREEPVSFERESQLDQAEENSYITHQHFLFEHENLIANLTKAIRLNRLYSVSLGWNQFHSAINDLLLPFSGQQNVSLGEEAFAQAVAAWQLSKGSAAKDADGIIGPNTWRMMKPLVVSTSSSPAHPTTPITPTINSASVQTEWNSSINIQSKYPDVRAYEIIRNQVVSWGVPNPAGYIDSAIAEWNANPGIQSHFGSFDGDPHNSYLNLKRLYAKQGISDPATYFSNNIVSITFFNRKSPGHRDLKTALTAAENSMKNQGLNYTFTSAWSFVPRTFNTNINSLSNHALGKAIDINPSTNPHITSANAIMVINEVCRPILVNGLLAESNPDVFRNASAHFKQTFNDIWVNQQTRADILKAVKNSRSTLNLYAQRGFFDLPTPLVNALKSAGLSWGGNWRTAKDFMHFELV